VVKKINKVDGAYFGAYSSSPESLLQTNRFHRFWIQAIEQYEVFGSEETFSMPD